MRQDWRVRGDHDDNRSKVLSHPGHVFGVGNILWNLPAYWHARDSQLRSPPAVALDENSDRVSASLLLQLARGGPDAAFESIADHPCPTPDRSLRHRAVTGTVERFKDMLIRNVKTIDVIQKSVPGFGHDRQRPQHLCRGQFSRLPQLPFDGRVSHHTYAMCICQQ